MGFRVLITDPFSCRLMLGLPACPCRECAGLRPFPHHRGVADRAAWRLPLAVLHPLNEEGEVPPPCAACHSETGFLDWAWARMAHPRGAFFGGRTPRHDQHGIGCVSCHVGEAEALDAVPSPRGSR